MRKITVEEARKLTVGSFEHLISRLDSALNLSGLVGSDAQILGTMEDHVVVLEGSGALWRIPYQDVSGSIEFGSPAVCDLPDDNPAGKIIAAVERKDTPEVAKQVRRLASGVVKTDDQVVEALIAHARIPRQWRRVFEAKAAKIRENVLDELTSISQDRVNPKFRPLHDGSIAEEDLGRYRTIVIEGLANIERQATALLSEIEKGLPAARGSNNPLVAQLAAFSEDLCADLAFTCKAAASRSTISRVDCLGRLHDVLAEGLHDKRVAARFAIKMTERLGEAI